MKDEKFYERSLEKWIKCFILELKRMVLIKIDIDDGNENLWKLK